MNLAIKCNVRMIDEAEPDILYLAINPENDTLPRESGIITSKIEGENVITTITGEMSIGRLINTVDDVLKSALLALNIISEIKD